MQLRPDMTLSGVVNPVVGPVSFFMTPIAVDDPVAFRVELEKVRGN